MTKILIFCFLILGCNSPSEKHLALESAQKSLDENLQMYEMVWEKVFNERNLDMINEEYFTQDVVAIGTSILRSLPSCPELLFLLPSPPCSDLTCLLCLK